MKWILAFLLMGAYALNFSYDGEVFVAPGEQKTVNIYVQSVNESGKYWLSCSTELSINCPTYIEVEAGKERGIPITFTAEHGSNLVTVHIGDKLIQFVVKSSNQTHVFYDRLARYEETFNNLETKHGPHHLIELGRVLISEGFSLYDEGEYIAVGGIAENLDSILSEYYLVIEIPKIEEEPTQLNLSFIPLLGFASIFALYVRSTRKPKERHVAEDLSKLLKKESGGVLIGKEEKN